MTKQSCHLALIFLDRGVDQNECCVRTGKAEPQSYQEIKNLENKANKLTVFKKLYQKINVLDEAEITIDIFQTIMVAIKTVKMIHSLKIC